jgi:hypothetical protein
MQSIQLFVNTKPSDVWQFQSATGNNPVFLNGSNPPPFTVGQSVMVQLNGSCTIAGLPGDQIVAGISNNSLQTSVTTGGYTCNISGGVFSFPEYKELDLIEFEVIRFTKEVSTIEEPERIASNYTKNFILPQTPKNGEFFKSVFNVNATDFDATKAVDAYINIDGFLFTSGDLRLNGISINNKTGLIEYDVIFIGETGSFGGSIASRLMNELDLSDLNHQVNLANLELSWNGYPNGLLQGKVLYPLIEWGYDYNASTKVPIQATLSVYQAVGGIRGFTNSTNPLLHGQFKPVVLVKTLWDKIFKEAGYSYESEFFKLPFFDKMYHVSTGPDTSGATIPVGNLIAKYYPKTQSLETALKVSTTSPLGSPVQWVMPNLLSSIIYDPYYTVQTDNPPLYLPSVTPPPPGLWVNLNSSRTYFEIPDDGNYRISVEGLFLISNKNLSTAEQTQFIDVYVYKNGLPLNSKSGLTYVDSGNNKKLGVNPNTNFDFPNTSTYYTFAKGDRIDIRLWRQAFNSGWQTLYINENKTVYSLYQENAEIDLNSMFPTNYKQIDLIKSISDKFKLIWEPDPQNPKNFLIEPWINWIKKGRLLDWTYKLNENKDIKVKPLFGTQPRLVTWKDLSESDVYNFSFQQKFKRGFGDTILDSDIQIIAGSRKIETKIAPFMIAPIGNSNTFLIPHLAKDTATERQPIEVTPRICFFNGLVPTPGGIEWHIIDDTGTISIPKQEYPLVSNFYKEYPNGPTGDLLFDGSAFDISWGNVKQYWEPILANINPVDYGNGITNQTSFNSFWGEWYEMTYDKNSRIIEAEFSLESNDIRDLRFNDRIWVRDAWYFPISIKDYVLNEKQNVKVELLKVGNLDIQVLDLEELEFCYTSIADKCIACCCTETIIVYGLTGGTNPADFDQLWGDRQGVTPAPNGWYSNPGATSAYYFTNGQQSGDSPCTGCACSPVLFQHQVCEGFTPQEVCCCSIPSIDVYGNGLNVSTSTQLWGDPGGTVALTPFLWVREPSGDAAQVGADGHTVIQYNNCSGVVC